MIVLDSNVVSETMRMRSDARVVQFVADHFEQLAITTVTIHEIWFGLTRLPEGRRRRSLTNIFLEFTESLTDPQILELTEPAARRSGLLRAQREAAGRPMDISDAQIAGIVLETGSSLATRNTKDFDRMGLDLIDPWQY